MPKPAVALPVSVAAGRMPEPSIALTVIALILRVVLRVLKPKWRREVLRELAVAMTEFDRDANVVRLRGREHDEAVAQTRADAAVWLRATLAAFFVADGERA